jgi:hypothetical protein
MKGTNVNEDDIDCGVDKIFIFSFFMYYHFTFFLNKENSKKNLCLDLQVFVYHH